MTAAPLDPRRHPRRLPAVRAGLRRPHAGLPRQRRHVAQAARRDRRGRRLQHALHGQRPPRHLHHRRGGHRGLRGGARDGGALPQRAGPPARSSSCATRPRPSTWSRTPGGAATSARRTRSCSPSWSTTRTWCPGSCWRRRRTRTWSSWPSTTRAGSTSGASRCCCARGPKLVAFTHVSNALGTINPVREMIGAGPRGGRAGARSTARRRARTGRSTCRTSDADFYVFSGHKTLGPTGSGALWARRELLEAMPPFMGGGEMIREVHLRHTTFNDVPWKFEAGTPGHRRGDRPRRGARLPRRRSAWTGSAPTSARLTAYALEMLPREVPGIRIHRARVRRRARRAS